jgi:hypothetical protein
VSSIKLFRFTRTTSLRGKMQGKNVPTAAHVNVTSHGHHDGCPRRLGYGAADKPKNESLTSARAKRGYGLRGPI